MAYFFKLILKETLNCRKLYENHFKFYEIVFIINKVLIKF